MGVAGADDNGRGPRATETLLGLLPSLFGGGNASQVEVTSVVLSTALRYLPRNLYCFRGCRISSHNR